MPNIYKIKIKGIGTSKDVYTRAGANDFIDTLEAKGYEAEKVLYKKDVLIYDWETSGKIQYYKEKSCSN